MERFSHLVVALGFLAFLFSIPGSRAVMGAGRAVAAQFEAPSPVQAAPPNSFALPGPFGGDSGLAQDILPERLDTMLLRLAELSRRVRDLRGDPARTFSDLMASLGERVEDLRDQLESLEGDAQSLDLFLAGMGAALDVMEQALDEAQYRMELENQVWI